MNQKNIAGLTRQEKLAVISDLQKSFNHSQEILLPDSEFYPEVLDTKQLERAGKKILVWLGIKPHDLNFVQSKDYPFGYSLDGDRRIINIGSGLTSTPFVEISLLTISCLSYYFQRKGYEIDTELIELASVEFGLGLLVLNSANSDFGIRSRLRQLVPLTRKSRISRKVLSYFSITEYSRLFTEYIWSNGLNKQMIVEHVLPWSKKALTKSLRSVKPAKKTDYVIKAEAKLQNTRLKLCGSIILFIMFFGICIFLILNKPRVLTSDLQKEKENIEILEASYKSCTDSLHIKQKQYDQSDIFMIRQLDSHITRCNSIQNLHDFLVKDYNQKLEQRGFNN